MQLVIHSVPQNISRIDAYLRHLFEVHHISQDLYASMLISLTEAVVNAMVHGNRLDDEKVVELQSEVESSRILFTIRDQGRGFDPACIPDPRTEENIKKEGGRGVMIMRELCSEVRFSDEGSTTTLVFELK